MLHSSKCRVIIDLYIVKGLLILTFNKRLIQLRKKENLYQVDVAKKIGVARATYGAYEQGNRQPDFETLRIIASFFNVTTDYLLGNSDHPQMSDDDKKAALIEEMARKYPEAEIMFDNLSGMTVEQLKEVDDFIRFKLQKRSD